jgi:tetratricopeptide (TPR) repeat protein
LFKFFILSALLAVAVLGFVGWDWYQVLPAQQTAHYVGSQACAKCHSAEFEKWQGSHHQLAMQLPTAQTVLGNFDNQQLEHFGVTSRMFRDGEKFCVETENKQGQLEKFTIEYVFGVHPLQQYLVKFADGRLQTLPLCWDTVGKKWFHIYPHEPIRANDPLHWTAHAQTWNHMCADCHSTNLQRKYDPATNQYHTTYDEISVGCEACHGPGSNHIAIAENKKIFWDRLQGYGLTVKLKDTNNRVQADTCAQCHALAGTLAQELRPGHPLHDYRTLQLLDGQSYHDDGQLLGEAYEYGSFMQSKMFHKNIKCSDCHDPHTNKLKHQGNQLCTSCHAHPAAKYDSPTHHFHQSNSQGAQCVECHMPHRTYMVVHDRRDHSLRVPRPDLSVKLGTPNACNMCHDKLNTPVQTEQTPTQRAQWAADQIVKWYGPTRAVNPHPGEILHAARLGKADIVPELIKLCFKPDTGANVRATAVSYVGQFLNGPQHGELLEALDKASKDTEILVVTTAVSQMSESQLLSHAQRLLTHDSRAVRHMMARRLFFMQDQALPDELRSSVEAVIEDFIAAQSELLDMPEANIQLARIATVRKQYEQAAKYYARALKITPQNTEAVLQRTITLQKGGDADGAIKFLQQQLPEHDQRLKQLEQDTPLVKDAETLDIRQRYIAMQKDYAAQMRAILAELIIAQDKTQTAQAEKLYQAAIELVPTSSANHFSLGALYFEQQQFDKAEPPLREALRLDASNDLARVVLARILLAKQSTNEAEELLVAGIKGQSADVASLALELGQLYLQQERWIAAEEILRYALRKSADPRLMQQLVTALDKQGKSAEAGQYRQRLQQFRNPQR